MMRTLDSIDEIKSEIKALRTFLLKGLLLRCTPQTREDFIDHYGSVEDIVGSDADWWISKLEEAIRKEK